MISKTGIRALHMVYSFTQGGAQRVAMSLAAGFPGSAVCSFMRVPEDQIAFPDIRKKYGVEHFFMTSFKDVLRLMEAYKFDIFHIHWCGADSDTTNLALIDWGYIKSHSDFPYVTAAHVEKAFPHVELTNFVCEAECQKRLQHFTTPLIPNGFDLDKFVYARDYSNKKEITIGFVCRLDAKLEQDFPRRIKEALARVEVPVKLLIIGDGDHRPRYEAGLREAGLRYEITGVRWDVHEALKDLDIFLYPPHADCLPTVVIEAMASGLPVVALPVGDIPYMLGNGRGYALPWEEMPAILQCLASDPGHRRTVGRAAQKYALATYSHDAMIRNWEAEYKSIIEKPRAALIAKKPASVSIIIPTYKRPGAAYVAAQSALAQDIPVEVIVVNDGDHQSDYSAVKKLPIKYIELPKNRGLSGARNAAIDVAKGEYIGFCDDDDRWYPFFAGRLAQTLTDNAEVSVAYGSGIATLDVTFERGLGKIKMDCGYPFDADRLYYQNFIAMSGTMIRKSVLKKVGGFDEAMHQDGANFPEDLEMWFRLMLSGHKFARCPVVGLIYNAGDGRGTTSATQNGMMARGMKYIEAKHNINLRYPF